MWFSHDFFSLLFEFFNQAGVVESSVEVTVSWWVPAVLGSVRVLGGDWEKGLLVDSRESVLVEHFDVDLAVVVLSQDLFGVFFGVKRVHQNKWYVRLVGLVQVLDLLHSEIQEVESRADRNH